MLASFAKLPLRRAGRSSSGTGGEAPTRDLLTQLSQRLSGMAYRRLLDERGTLLLASLGCKALTGFDHTDLSEDSRVSYGDLVHPADRPRLDAALSDAARSHGTFHVDYRIRRVDGRELRVWDLGHVFEDDEGRSVAEGIVTAVGAPSPRREEDRVPFEALVEQSLAGIYLIRDDAFRYVNGRFAEVFAYSVDEILALPSYLDLVHPEDRRLVEDNVRRRIEGAAEKVRYEFRGLAADGSTVDVEVHGGRVELDGPCILGILLDVTERKRAERRAREGEKLEAVRRLAAGAAHDLNNVMATIKATAEVLRIERAGDVSLSEDLSEIVRAVDKGSELSRQLSRFARGSVEHGETASPTAVLRGMRPSLLTMLGRRIDLQVEVADRLPPLRMGSSNLEEVVLSLALSAQDAMPDGGSLSLRAFRRSEPVDGDGRPAAGNVSIVLEVADTGSGGSAEKDERSCESGLPTRRDRETGLGLAIVARIVKEAGGTIELLSSSEGGTTARVVLPAALSP